MDHYLRDFDDREIVTYVLENSTECSEVIHNNIRSVSKNLDQFKILLEQFESAFECIVLTETFNISDKELNMFNIEGYQLIYNEALIIFINIEITNIEKNNITITAVYRSPTTCPKEFVTSLDRYLEKKKNSNYNIFLGDININIYQPNEDLSHDYLNTMYNYGYKSYINDITREVNNSRSCLDHIFIKSSKNFAEEMIIPCIIQTCITDHYTVTAQIVLNNKIIPKSAKIGKIKYINYKKLRKELSEISWNEIKQVDLDTAVDTFINVIQNKINICANFVTINHKNKRRKKWITNVIIKQINKRDEMYKHTVGSNLAKKIPMTPLQIPEKRQKNSIFLYPITPPEIVNIIKELKNRKSPGIDEITSNILKEISVYITEPLTYIINKSITEDLMYPSNALFQDVKVMDIRSLYYYQCILYQWQHSTSTTPPLIAVETRGRFKTKEYIMSIPRKEIHETINPKQIFNAMF
ncbi:hypothetical protein NQ317_005720 [Molorchus minor]|uniref:Endonuclease/exonuclease/phosphatase domain-containing protein n=1 Tax=Molorchus minor TaxID=1323400 RepID=A0ABQ9J2J4_9CUCU|nr:hypothetical protein NQ317_005720 [Molorchus minor]